MDQAVGVGHVVQSQHVAAERHGFIELRLPGRVVGQFFSVEDHADGDLAPRIVEAVAQHAVVRPVNGHQIARPGLFHAIDPLAIEKRVPARRADKGRRDRRRRVRGEGTLAEDVADDGLAEVAFLGTVVGSLGRHPSIVVVLTGYCDDCLSLGHALVDRQVSASRRPKRNRYACSQELRASGWSI